jgi:hypothetical protein
MAFFPKQPASRINRATNLSWVGTGTVVSTNFGPATWQVRVISPVAGYIAIDNLGTVPTTAGATGTFIAANVANGDTFACTPGEVLSFSSSSTSSASVNLTELT